MVKKIILIFCIILISLSLYIIISNVLFSVKDNSTSLEINNHEDVKGKIKEVFLTIMPTKNVFFNSDTDKLKMDLLFQEGEDGHIKTGYYGYSINDANGTIKLNIENIQTQNSYKINLDDSMGFWHGMDVFYLNKYSGDNLKIRTKLSSDLHEIVSDFAKPNTELVNVYIKDSSSDTYEKNFLDCGLYTVLEDINKDFLLKNGLDIKGWLYEAENFKFYRYEDNLKTIEDSDFSNKEFENILRIEGNEDHNKLFLMLDAVNSGNLSINQIIDKYFDEDNYLTWLAFNILIGNTDSRDSNFYLYSSLNSDKWYFIIGDYTNIESLVVLPWQEGISNYLGVELHKRYLQVEDNRNKLTERLEELSNLMSEDVLLRLLESYKPLVANYLSREPNILTLKYIVENKEKYYESLKKPSPVDMFQPKNYGEYILFSWSDSYDFQQNHIQYILDISNSPYFDTVFYHGEGITKNEQAVVGLKQGHYYWRLRIKDSEGNIQVPFNTYIDGLGKYCFGVQEFFIN